MTPEELKQRRLELGMTQRDLARALGVQTALRLKELAMVYLWESGRRNIPPDLDFWLKWLKHRQLIARNQPLIDQCAIDMEQMKQLAKEAGVYGEAPSISMFNADGKLIYWWYTPDHPIFRAIGEIGDGRCYAVPKAMHPSPIFQLPEYYGMKITRPDGTTGYI